MSIAIYARKSIEGEDRQIQSLEDQVRELRALARREGLPAPIVYEEARSAKEPGTRPEFTRLMADVEAGRIGGILTWSISRLARNSFDGGLVAYRLQSGSLPFIRTPDRTYRPEDNALLLSVESGMATAYLQDLSRNVSRGMRGKVERGWHSSKAPLGYRNDPETREIVRDDERWDLVRRAWDQFLAGTSVGEIHRRLVAAGLAVRSRRRKPGPVSRAKIHLLFRDPFYAGSIRFKGELMRGRHEPMVTAEEFARAQEILVRPRLTKRPREAFAFAGAMRCAECGCAVVGERRVKHYVRTGRTSEYVYYHCSGSKGCPKRAMREEEIVDAVLPVLARAAIAPEFAGWLREAAATVIERGVVGGAVDAVSLERTAEREERRLRELTSMRLDGEIAPAEYGELRVRLVERISEARAALDSVRERHVASLRRFEPVIALAEESGREFAENRPPDAAALGRLLRLAGRHVLNPMEFIFRPDRAIAKIAALEPVGSGSPRPERGDLVPLDSVWWTLVEDLLRTVVDQCLEIGGSRASA